MGRPIRGFAMIFGDDASGQTDARGDTHGVQRPCVVPGRWPWRPVDECETPSSTSPNRRNTRVSRDRCVPSDKRALSKQCLGNQHAVERVTMDFWKRDRIQSHGPCKRYFMHAMTHDCLLQKLIGRHWKKACPVCTATPLPKRSPSKPAIRRGGVGWHPSHGLKAFRDLKPSK